MNLSFLFRDYNLKHSYISIIRSCPVYPVNLTLNDIETRGYQLSQLFFSSHPMQIYPATDSKDWRDYEVKKL